MEATVHASEQAAVIRVSGRFDFNGQREFRGAVERALAETGARQIEVDLAGVGYVDSSALGMLLMLRDKARMVGRPVVIAGAQGSVRQVLEIANFAKLFSIL